MGTVKKYNSKAKRWEVIATSDANAISVRSEKLLPEGHVTTNVEQVLVDMHDDVQTLKGNVSWLALYGGGGSGGGGGTGVTAELTVNNLKDGSEIIFEEEKGLLIKVQSSSSVLTWNISASFDNKVISSASGVTQLKITKEDLDKAKASKTFLLAITAENPDTLTQVFWNGKIVIPSVHLSVINSFEYPRAEYQKYNLKYTYDVAIQDTYKLMVNDVEMWSGTIDNYTGSIEIPLTKLLGDDPPVGASILKSYLVSVGNEAIKSPIVITQAILTADSPIISCTTLSSDSKHPTEQFVGKGTSTVILAPFTVYFLKGSYQSIVRSSLEAPPTKEEFSLLLYKRFNTLYTNESCSFTWDGDYNSENATIGITIYILYKSEIISKTYYIKAIKQEYAFLDTGKKDNLVFDFTTLFGGLENENWVYKTKVVEEGVVVEKEAALMHINNSNDACNTIDNITGTLRLQNTAYGAIRSLNPNESFRDSIKKSGIPEFTLCLSYKCDFHSGNNRTILQWANQGTENGKPIIKGIVVKDHQLFINSDFIDLQDNEQINLTITFQSKNENDFSGTLFIYVNGVLETAYNTSFTDLFGKNVSPIEDTIFIGAGYFNLDNDKAVKEFTDLNISRVALYNACLNPYEVLLDNLNTEACIHWIRYNSSLIPNMEYIKEGLRRNFIVQDKEGNLDPLIWDKTKPFSNSQDVFFDNFTINRLVHLDPVTNDASFISKITTDYSIPIPMLLIDVSKATNWTWENFITPNADLGSVDNAKFEYFDQSGSNKKIIKGLIKVQLQGTSTKGEYIKNLKISFDKSIFIPKETWFPENTYTLKADIIDSSHSLNAAIGQFVNSKLGLQYDSEGTILPDKNAWYPYSETVEATFRAEKNKKDSAINKYFPKATLKHGIEGFPVFLIMHFAGNADEVRTIATLGIYQFILGRDSARNLGYEIIKEVKGYSGDQITYPFYTDSAIQINTESNEGYWIEFKTNESFGKDVHFEELNSISDTKFIGPFWQPASDTIANEYYDKTASIEYSNVKDAETSIRKIKPFSKFIQDVVSLPVTNRIESTRGTSYLSKNTFYNVNYPRYSYEKINESVFGWVLKEPSGNHILDRGDPLEPLVKDNKRINLESISKYFVISMFLGLIDNFQKNLPFKLFKRKDAESTWEAPILGIYDTDTGCGGNNQASLNVPEYMWLSSITNTSDYTMKTTSERPDTAHEYTVIGNANKLWYLDSEPLNYSMFGESSYRYGSIYASEWFSLLNYLNITDIDQLVDLFVDNYFIPQTKGCGELLFNLTYFAKYLNKYKGSSSSIQKLHGRRIFQVKHWLKNRVRFLHSMFLALSPNRKVANPVVEQAATITTGSAPRFSVTMNHPVIMRHVPQGSNIYFCFCEDNVETPIYWGYSEITPNGVSQVLAPSDSIQKLGNDDISLKQVYFQDIKSGTLENLVDLNLADCKSIQPAPTFMNSFKPAKGISELRSLNLQGTAQDEDISFVVDLQSGFSKLQNLYLQGSCVSSLILPDNPNIPLINLNIRGSKVKNLTLSSQNLIEDLDITNCSSLDSLVINNCQRLTSLELDDTQRMLQSIEISSQTFKSIHCTKTPVLKTITINSNNLEEVVIKNCFNLKSIDVISESVKTIDLSDCYSLDSLYISNPEVIETLNLGSTSIKYIKTGTSVDTSKLDLHEFVNLKNFNIGGNSKVEYIQFPNNRTPFALTNTFGNCTALKRIYGNVSINRSSMFTSCKNFSIHGSDINQVVYDGTSGNQHVVSNYRILHPSEITGCTDASGKPVFQEGFNVTNMTFGTYYGYATFQGTNCTIFDVYYIFANLGALTNASQLFWGCYNARFNWGPIKDKDTGEFIMGSDGTPLIVDNSPNKNLFKRAGQVTTISQAFTLGTYRLFSPTMDVNGAVPTANDGLLSPLINCTSMYDTWIGTAYIDRHLFRRKKENGIIQYAITSLGLNSFDYIVDDVNSLERPVTTEDMKQELLKEGNLDSYGNLSNFFVNLENLEGSTSGPAKGWTEGFFDHTTIINYGITENCILPEKVTGLHRCFNAYYAVGEFSLNKFFIKFKKESGNPKPIALNTSTLKVLTNSFCVFNQISTLLGNEDNSKQSFINIDRDFFKNFPKLQEISYNNGNGGFGINLEVSKKAEGYLPFEGFRKTIVDTDSNEFFNKLLENNPDITKFDGFFINTKYNWAEAHIPGNLFNGKTKLISINRLFENFNGPDKSLILTSNSFTSCRNLSEAYKAFADNLQRFKGFIPRKFFYHGYDEKVINWECYDLPKDYDPNELVEKTEIIDGVEVTVKKPKGTGDYPMIPFNRTYKVPRTTIKDLQKCFSNNSFTEYKQTIPATEAERLNLLEDNPNYCPYNYKTDGFEKWKKLVVDTNDKTYIWSYDGFNQWDKTNGVNVETYTSPGISNVIPTIYKYGSLKPGTLNFMCAPDLLRYCVDSSETNIQGLFELCGHLYNGNSGDGRGAKPDFGIHGRIVPYLLKPVSRVNNISKMFKYCDWISSYDKNGSTYLIPEDFFTYNKSVTILRETFSGLCFAEKPVLQVFSTLTGVLDIKAIFRYPYFRPGTVISNVFTSNYISNAQEAFCTYPLNHDTDSDIYNGNIGFVSSGSGWIYDHQVTFDGNFKVSKFLNEPDWFVYAGYASNNVTFNNKTLNTDRQNYKVI